MRWFGQSWGAPVCLDSAPVPTPIGEPCAWCGEPIADGDDGLILPCLELTGWVERPWHEECHLRSIVGGYHHLLGTCSCHGGPDDPDPTGLTKRDAARLAAAEWIRQDALRKLVN